MSDAYDAARVIVLGFGNPSRGDDALAWELLRLIAAQRCPTPGQHSLELVADTQLQIEHALQLAHRDLALFVDASVPGNASYHFTRISAARDTTYTSHALSPAAVLYVYEQLFSDTPPPAFLLSIRGTQFGLDAPLSAEASAHLKSAFRFWQELCQQPYVHYWELFSAPYHPRCQNRGVP